MNFLVLLIAFAAWAFLMRYLTDILQFVRLYKFSATIPGPGVRELIENARKGQVLAWLKELRHKHGSVFRIWFGKDLMIFFSDPDDIRNILGSNTLLYKSPNYKVVEPWLGKGLLTSGGEAWHRRRKMLTPAFHFKTLSQFKEPLEENCKILVSKLMDKANGTQFDIYPFITLFALDAICETAMGIKKNAQMQSDSEYVTAVQQICRILHKKSFSFWQRFNVFFDLTAAGRARKNALKVLHEETNRVIRLRRKKLEAERANSMTDAEYSDDLGETKKRIAFLDMLLISQMEGTGLTDREIREEVDTFMFEGHDTTSSAIGFALYLFSQHADVQQKAYEEAVALEGKEKEPMKYLEAVIKETLRIYPSVPTYSRHMTDDFEIRDMRIPKGASISILTYMVHRDEKNFPDPEKFDPDRFLTNANELHPFAHVAFSAGPRNCIGQKFAMLELKCTLSSLLRNFEFLPVDGFKPSPLAEIIMKSDSGIQVRMKLR